MNLGPLFHRNRPVAVARAALAAVLAGGLVTGCGPRGAPEARAEAQPPAAGVIADTMTVRAPLELPAQLYVERDAAVVARSAGTVDSVAVDLGARVGGGSLLARLEDEEQELAVAQAEATFENVSRLVARARVMTKAGGITVADSEQVEFQYAQADIARRKARRDLDLTRILAPFAGVVSARSARPGRFVSAGDTLFRVTETGPLLARVRVPEGSIATVNAGDRVVVAGITGATASAVVVQAAPAIDAASGTREVVLRVANGTPFLPGASVTVRLGDQRRHVVTVPRDAVAPEGYVLVIENDRTSMRPVTVGADVGGGRVEIVSGLAAGERVARQDR